MGLPEGQPPDDEPPAGEGPTIAIEAPADGLLTAQTPIAVSGSVTGIPEPAVDVNGVVATVADGSFHASVPLLEGANTLAAAATNPSGSAHDAVSVTLDTTPPVVTITAPADGSRTTEAQTPVNGTVLDASPIASVTVNGVAATLDGGSFSATVPLTLGDNPITAVATDAVGNQGSDSVTTIRGSAPEVAITAPADGAELDVSPAIVMGTVAGTPPVAVVVNGVAVAVSEGSFTTSIPLQEGANTLTATASNDFGQASDAVAVSLVTAPELVVAIETPPDGATVSSSRIAVAGSVSEPEAAVSVNGVVATVSGTTWVAAAVKVSEGENLLTATATRGGASASDTSAVFLNLPPKIVITSPRDGAVLRDPDTDVEGFVDDVTAFVDVNGVNASVDSGGRFLAREVPLDPGTNVLTGRAVDPQGATGRDAVEVTRDDATAGRLRIVLVLDGASSGFETEPLIAEDGAEFAEALRAIGFAPERFEPAIEAPARGRVSFHLFVFAEAGVVGEPVAVPAISEVFFRLDDILPLLPMDQLEVEMEEASLDPSLRGALVPSDFEPNGFTRFGAEVVEVPQ